MKDAKGDASTKIKTEEEKEFEEQRQATIKAALQAKAANAAHKTAKV